MKLISCSLLAFGAIATAVLAPSSAPQQAPTTPPEVVATYGSLADAILAVKKTEHDLVVSMLTGTYRHAEAKIMAANDKLGSGQGQAAKADVEAAAALVAQLGNEGDNSVAAIRKRLLDGGFHHNAAGEAQGLFDEGFVIVNKEMKKTFLESAVAIGKMAGNPTAAGLTAEWEKVKAAWGRVAKGGK
jgi:hypothetical protein